MNTAASLASLAFPRRSFIGSTDKYSSRNTPQFRPGKELIAQAIKGAQPYDVTGEALGNADRDVVMTRLALYENGQDFYDGNHWTSRLYGHASGGFSEGTPKTVFNYCKIIVDKAVDWFTADGWSVVCDQGNEQVAEFLNAVWKLNNRDRLTQKGVQAGAIKGEHYIYVTVRTKNRYGADVPRKKWTVRLQVLSPEHVFPIWSDSEARKMKACFIQFPVTGTRENTMQLYSVWITPEKITTYLDNEIIEDIENPVGEVNVVHVPNFEESNSNFGGSDIDSIIPINVEYNTVADSIRTVIKYHAEPTTIIYGARASTLEKGANSVWSGLPEPGKAKVENLVLQTDLAAVYNYLDMLRQSICELSSTPKVALDSFDVKVATSTAAAFELMFQPLVEKTRRRRIPHTEAIAEVNRLIVLFHTIVIGDTIALLADDIDSLYESEVEYTNPLPRDESVELDTAIKRFNAGVWSRAEMIRRCSKVKNYERLILELIADKRAALAETYEKQRALLGERPNSLSAFLGSECLSEDLQTLQEEIATLEKLSAAPKP